MGYGFLASAWSRYFWHCCCHHEESDFHMGTGRQNPLHGLCLTELTRCLLGFLDQVHPYLRFVIERRSRSLQTLGAHAKCSRPSHFG